MEVLLLWQDRGRGVPRRRSLDERCHLCRHAATAIHRRPQ